MSNDNGYAQALALNLPAVEAEAFCRRMQETRFLVDRGIKVYAVPSLEPFVQPSGASVPGACVMVRAETDMACGIGVGYVVALA